MNPPTATHGLLSREARLRLCAITALGLAGWVLVASLAAFSPDLHKHLHPAASDPGHFCFLTLLGQHLVAAVDGEILTPKDIERTILLLSDVRVLFPHFDCEFPPGRAPPSFFSSRTGRLSVSRL